MLIDTAGVRRRGRVDDALEKFSVIKTLQSIAAAEVAVVPPGSRKTLSVEHPTGEMSCVLEVDDAGEVVSAALLRTARKLMDGVVFA